MWVDTENSTEEATETTTTNMGRMCATVSYFWEKILALWSQFGARAWMVLSLVRRFSPFHSFVCWCARRGKHKRGKRPWKPHASCNLPCSYVCVCVWSSIYSSIYDDAYVMPQATYKISANIRDAVRCRKIPYPRCHQMLKSNNEATGKHWWLILY